MAAPPPYYEQGKSGYPPTGPYPPQPAYNQPQPPYGQPQPQYGQPQQPYYGQQQGGYTQQPLIYPQQPNYGAPSTSTVNVIQVPSHVVGSGNCPICHNGFINQEYTVCGIILAVLFFPIGVLCCLMMTEKRCSHCHAVL